MPSVWQPEPQGGPSQDGGPVGGSLAHGSCAGPQQAPGAQQLQLPEGCAVLPQPQPAVEPVVVEPMPELSMRAGTPEAIAESSQRWLKATVHAYRCWQSSHKPCHSAPICISACSRGKQPSR